jgi:hypothetical protein
MTRLLGTTLFFTLSISIPAAAQGFSPACENLLAQLQETNTRIAEVTDVYECGPEFTFHVGDQIEPVQGCLVLFTEHDTDGNKVESGSFLDSANNYQVGQIHPEANNWFRGVERNGFRVCSPINTYINARAVDNHLDVRVIKSTANDEFRCPFYKLYVGYSFTCTKASTRN